MFPSCFIHFLHLPSSPHLGVAHSIRPRDVKLPWLTAVRAGQALSFLPAVAEPGKNCSRQPWELGRLMKNLMKNLMLICVNLCVNHIIWIIYIYLWLQFSSMSIHFQWKVRRHRPCTLGRAASAGASSAWIHISSEEIWGMPRTQADTSWRKPFKKNI